MEKTLKKSSKKSNKKVNTETESEEVDYSEWSKIKMKKKITAYMLEYYEGEELPDLDIETMREWCKLVDQEEELPLEDVEEEEETESETVEEKEEISEIPSTTRDRIAALKAKAAASKK